MATEYTYTYGKKGVGGSSPLILVIEDDQATSRLIAFKLKKDGYDFELRDNGKRGLEAIKGLRPDLVILDVMLPSLNGFEILRQIRSDNETKNMKVIMLTSKNREEDLERGFNLEVEDYIDKPFKPAELLMRVNKVLRN